MKRTRPSTSLLSANARRVQRDAFTIATQAPQVVSMRLTRMALHGMSPNTQERAEMRRMSQEKVNAFGESWAAMGMQALRTQQSLWAQGLSQWATWWPQVLNTTAWLQSGGSTQGLVQRQARALREGVAQVAAAGLGPVSRRVKGNARRLKRQR